MLITIHKHKYLYSKFGGYRLQDLLCTVLVTIYNPCMLHILYATNNLFKLLQSNRKLISFYTKRIICH